MNKKVILSLTTYGKRIETVHLTIDTLLNQTKKADKVILWLAEDEFNSKTIPNSLKKLIKKGLEIDFCKDIKSYKKLIPTLQKYPNDIIITFDDDIFYPNDTVEKLYNAYVKNPEILHCMRGHLMKFDLFGRLKSYKKWKKSPKFFKESLNIFPTTGAGTLFVKEYFHKDVCREDIFMELSPRADDVWAKAMTLAQGTKCQIIKHSLNRNLKHIDGTQENGLWQMNKNEATGNNPQIKAVFEKYNLAKFNTQKKYKDYKKVFLKKTKKDKLNVLFLVNQNEKWACDSLYNAMHKDDFFNPAICVTPLYSYGKDKMKSIYNNNLAFFKKKKFKILNGYNFDKNKIINLKKYNPDIIFYQQPWDIAKKHNIKEVSKFALTCYVPYSVLLANNPKHYNSSFQHNLWKLFLDSESNLIRFKNNMKNKAVNCIASGYPKLDYFLDKKNLKGDKTTIIYAPHHSFEANGLRYATFEWNGKEILDFAKQNPNIKFIFKPHPRFKFAVVKNNIMTEKEVNDYYENWEKLDNCSIYDKGDYLDLFSRSDLLITDCGSFLGEYSFLEKPVIQLISKESVGYNSLGDEITEGYYKVHSIKELRTILDIVLLKKDDFMSKDRIGNNSGLIKKREGSGVFIKNYIKNEIKGN